MKGGTKSALWLMIIGTPLLLFIHSTSTTKVFGITRDENLRKLRKFIDLYNLTFPILYDREGRLFRQLSIEHTTKGLRRLEYMLCCPAQNGIRVTTVVLMGAFDQASVCLALDDLRLLKE